MSVALAVLPNAGLGNKLLVWAKAALFAHKHEVPLGVIGWSWPKLGALLRGELSRRYYSRCFVSRYSHVAKALSKMAAGTSRLHEPCPQEPVRPGNAVYLFYKIPHWSDYFGAIRDERDLVRKLLYAELAPRMRAGLEASPRPCIAVHVRHGDFRDLRPGENFAHLGAIRTPLAYFEGLIGQLRTRHGKSLPVTLFSDGSDDELAPLLALDNVTRFRGPNDVIELLHMSRADLIIAAAGSTFSQWAGYLADAPLLMHPNHIHKPIRPDVVNKRLYEGAAPVNGAQWAPLLHENMERIETRMIPKT